MSEHTKLFIIEGADGTGKTTLANKILEETKGHMLHATYKPEWQAENYWGIHEYHTHLFNAALNLMNYQDVILDRWAPSEEVYANAYRGQAKYSADNFMIDLISKSRMSNPENIRFIYCDNENVEANHEVNKQSREEMFDDISPVVKEYRKYIENSQVDWLRYDFNKNNIDDFVKEIIR